MTLNLDDLDALEAVARAAAEPAPETFSAEAFGAWAMAGREYQKATQPEVTLALITRLREAETRLREAEAVISEALNHDPLHGSKEGLHCGGMAPCIRETLTAHEPWNYEK